VPVRLPASLRGCPGLLRPGSRDRHQRSVRIHERDPHLRLPAFLALIMLVVGTVLDTVQLAVCVAQVAILVGAAWLGSRRIGQALAIGGLSGAIFFCT